MSRSPDHARRASLSERAYRLFVLLYPREIRRRHGAELLELFRDREAQVRNSGGTFATLWRFLLGDLVNARFSVPHVISAPRRVPGRGDLNGRPVRSGSLARMLVALDGLGRDVKVAIRGLARNPGFTLVAVFTLAMGIGADTAAFSLLDGAVLRPLPFADAERLVQLDRVGERLDARVSLSPTSAMAAAWRERATSFDLFGAYGESRHLYLGAEEPQTLRGVKVSPELLTIIGAVPLAGRLLSAADTASGRDEVVLLSEGFCGERSVRILL